MPVNQFEFDTIEEEILFIGREIESLKKNGAKYNEIAIISSKHKVLSAIAYNLNSLKIPITYEKQENILDLPHLIWVMDILHFISQFNKFNFEAANETVYKIISQPIFNIPSLVIYDLAVGARKNRNQWLQEMSRYECNIFSGESENVETSLKVKEISLYLTSLAQFAVFSDLETVLDVILGTDITPLEKFVQSKNTNINTNINLCQN